MARRTPPSDRYRRRSKWRHGVDRRRRTTRRARSVRAAPLAEIGRHRRSYFDGNASASPCAVALHHRRATAFPPVESDEQASRRLRRPHAPRRELAGRARKLPALLELLRRFCNSSNPENGAERFRDPDQLDAWLDGEGLDPVRVDRAGLRRVIRFRGRLRALAVANRDGRVDQAAFDSLVSELGARVAAPRHGRGRSRAHRTRVAARRGCWLTLRRSS